MHPALVRIGQGDFYEGVGFRYDPAINVARDGRLGDRGSHRDNNDFAPRLGIAWSPTDRLTVRAGAGVGNSNYHSLALRLQRRFAQGFSLMGSYTWSKSVDLTSGARNHVGDIQFPQDAYCWRCERGLSNFNVAHRFVTSALYELPFGKGKPLLNREGVVSAVMGGWQISSILTMQTGTPFDVVSGYDAGNRGYNFNPGPDRPNSTGVNAALPGDVRNANRFFDKNAFVKVPAGTLGNVGRNTLVGPGLLNLDLSLFKTFEIREQQQLQFRFESFNGPITLTLDRQTPILRMPISARSDPPTRTCVISSSD